MINSFLEPHSSTTQEETSSLKVIRTNKKVKPTKKKKKTIPEKTLDITCYTDLRARHVATKYEPYRSTKAFITRTKIINDSFKNEISNKCFLMLTFPAKNEMHFMSDNLVLLYEKLAKTYTPIDIENGDGINKDRIKEFIIDLISIKQDIVKIWNTEHPTKPYKYGSLEINGEAILEDQMLDFVQVKLFNCYSSIDDDENKKLILDQLFEQKTVVCFDLLITTSMDNIKNHNDLDKLNLKDMFTQFVALEKSYEQAHRGKKNQIIKRIYHSNYYLDIIISILWLFLEKTKLNLFKINISNPLIINLVKVIRGFAGIYSCRDNHNDNYKENIRQLSIGISFYYDNLDKPLFQGIHNTILKVGGIAFVEEFSFLIGSLKEVDEINKKYFLQDRYKNKLKLRSNFDKINTANNLKMHNIKEQVKILFIKYNIPTSDIDSWYSVFLKKSFMAVFIDPKDIIVMLAEWINASQQAEKTQRVNATIPDNTIMFLDEIIKDHKKLIDDKVEWDNIPLILLSLLYNNQSMTFTFGTPEIAKNKDFATLFAKTTQAFQPFLGTALLTFANKDSYDDLFANMDMLEYIYQHDDKSKYAKSSEYLIAQIITHIIENNDKLEFKTKQFLFNKAEKLYLKIAEFGINRAYLLLADTLAFFAKKKCMHKIF